MGAINVPFVDNKTFYEVVHPSSGDRNLRPFQISLCTSLGHLSVSFTIPFYTLTGNLKSTMISEFCDLLFGPKEEVMGWLEI